MKIFTIDGKEYKLPNSLNPFQQEMYVHLINWKWQHITLEPGKDRDLEYDAILPESYADKFPILYPEIKDVLIQHHQKFSFRIHKYFNHMASSQAANINLFLPILLHPNADAILENLKPDFARIARSKLDHGYRIEFWDEESGKPKGNLNDKNAMSGTDADLVIAYYNHKNELCLWLIEHKLTEHEFTECGGYKSKGRCKRHDCNKSFSQLLADKHSCYYHDQCGYEYWNITEVNRNFFPNHARHTSCPFQGGMNQLWRNQLLGLSVEQDECQPYQHVYFSVVRHSRNTYLGKTLEDYQEFVDYNPKFSVFTSADVINAATTITDIALNRWIKWYRNLYDV
jgi:hypothetical protein